MSFLKWCIGKQLRFCEILSENTVTIYFTCLFLGGFPESEETPELLEQPRREVQVTSIHADSAGIAKELDN